MQSENRFFDDLSRLVNGAAGTLAGVGREFEANAREKAKQWMSGMDFVSREEFEAVKAMAAAARAETEVLKARLDALERNAPHTATAPAAKKASAKARSAKGATAD
ncbi:MAG: accessory factor UbiK family protein [Sphingobium sp.]|nr:accessory factor UbiK family protein [Sphingobium sp.]MBP8671881.1 accessory factor UbiK family protein [Sphingobium sp.]MBP9158873.1 accessory factor UbiK family protein [Sphingobium sp.]MCC6481640.1 accessory factor UbiK family protein [Sphingomonadaceae bacterium]